MPLPVVEQMTEQPIAQTADNRPTESCDGPWYTHSGYGTLTGPDDYWLCEVCGIGCPEPRLWTGKRIIIASVFNPEEER